MKPKTIKIDDDVRAVLERATIEGNGLRLPQMEQKLYVKVAKVLGATGGRWSRKANATIFPDDPRVILGLALESGEVVDEKKTRKQFFTPPTLVRRMASLRWDGDAPERILEPSAGHGALIAAVKERLFEQGVNYTNIVAVENDPKAFGVLRKFWGGIDKSQVSLWNDDFLELSTEDIGKFGAVIMNPPFTAGQEIAHVKHALNFLAPGGRLVAVMSAAIMTRDNAGYGNMRTLLKVAGATFEDLPEGTFSTSGTAVRTVLVRI